MDMGGFGAFLDEARRACAVPGAQLGVLQAGEKTIVCSGYRSASAEDPVAPETPFHAGSIAKSLAALVVLDAARRSELGLDAPCAEQGVPGWQETPRQLLAQTTGRPNVLPDLDEDLDAFVDRVAAMPLVHEPGQFSYCNAGWSVLDLLLRRTVGAAFEEVAGERVLGGGRFGMPDGGAAGHAVRPGEAARDVPPDFAAAASAAGSRWWATADELLDLAGLHLADGAGRFDPDDVRAMRAPTTPIPGATAADAWGLGWAVWRSEGHHAFGWAGFTGGHRAFLRCFPEHDAAVVLLANAAGPLLSAPGGSALFDTVLPAVLDHLGIPAHHPQPVPEAAVPASALAGSYGPVGVGAGGGPDSLVVDGSVLGEPEPVAYERTLGNRFVVPGEPAGSMPIAFRGPLLYVGPMAMRRTD